MGAGLQLWDAAGHLVFDTNDRAAGGIQSFSTGTANGSYTVTPDTGQTVEFVYNMPLAWSPSGTASPWPTIGVSGNTITWSFNASASSRTSVSILAVTY